MPVDPSDAMTLSASITHHRSASLSGTGNAAIILSARRITTGLVLVIAGLLAGHLVSEAVATAWYEPERLRHFFSLNSEAAPGAWFSSLQLLLCAVLLTVIARKGYGNCHPAYWAVLAFGFYFLALDEGAQIHELMSPLMHTVMGRRTGMARLGWFIPVIPVVIVVGLCYLRFLMRLPRGTAIQFVIGASLFLGGSIGIEIGASYYKEAMAAVSSSCRLDGPCGYGYSIMLAVEEGMEMIGITIFANALLHIMPAVLPRSELRFSH